MYKLFLEATGLIFNLVGTSVLVIPFLKCKIWENDNDEEIPDGKFGQSKNGKHWFTRNVLLKNRKIALWGLFLILFGFSLQFLSIFL